MTRAQAEAPPRVVVHVIDYARDPSRDLNATQHVVAELFGSIGVNIVWREQRGPIAPVPGPGDVSVVILPPNMVQQKCEAEQLPDVVLGAAAPFPARRAWVFYDRIHQAAFERSRSVTWVLGYVMAHEIAHILGLPDHAERGVMTRTFEANAELQGGFSAEQGRNIRAGIQLSRTTGIGR